MNKKAKTEAEGSPWTRGGFLFSAGFLTLIVILLVILLFMLSTGGTPEAGNTPVPTPTSETGGPTSDSPPDDGPADIPTTAPEGVEWKLYQGVALPYSAKLGPRQVSGSVAAQYAHSPTGALLAAVHVSIRKLVGPDWRSVLDASVMPGPGRDVYTGLRAQVTDGAAPGELGQIAGFRYINYTPQTATMQVVSRFANSGTLQMVTLTMQWSDGEWKMVMQPNGSSSPNAQAVPSLSGFVAWGGV